VKIFKIFKDKQSLYYDSKALQKAIDIDICEQEYDSKKEALQTYLMGLAQTHLWVKYKAIGRFYDDPKENKEFIKKMDPLLKRKLGEYQNAKNNYTKLLTEK
tara:strand:- start:192 stop:497 length:306 start_codon:yes stop_codon:yes gene_type:complete